MNEKRDKIISKFFLIPAGAIVLYWIVNGIIELVKWFATLPHYSSQWWIAIGNFCSTNLSIIVIAYIFICLQVSGIAEFKYRKNFLKSFILATIITPPLMMLIWGKRV